VKIRNLLNVLKSGGFQARNCDLGWQWWTKFILLMSTYGKQWKSTTF